MDKSTPVQIGTNEHSRKASNFSSDTTTRRRTNAYMVPNALLIWVDTDIIEDNNDNSRQTVTKLRRLINTVHKTFHNGDEFLEFFNQIEDDKVFLILPGYFGQQILSMVHSKSQLDSIYILCGDKTKHEKWVQQWPKIKGVFTRISLIYEALRGTACQYNSNDISISLAQTSSEGVAGKKLHRPDPTFMYTQILKQILLTIEFTETHVQQFIHYCRDRFAKDDDELSNVDEFEGHYYQKTPITWYTCQNFLYPMLNHALRLMDVDIIVRMGFFIRDLHHHIEQLHSKQYLKHHSTQTFTVYRGQGLSKTDFEQMVKTRDGLLSFNNFLSTSKTQKISLNFAHMAATQPNMVGVLFIMKIDPFQATTPFASIGDISDYKEEDEVLFSMHAVFRIGNVKPMNDTNSLYEVNLELTSDNDEDVRAVTDHIQKEILPNGKGWFRLGSVLLKMGQADKAGEIYEVLLEQAKNENEKAGIYHQLGRVRDNQGRYHDATAFQEEALAIYQTSLVPSPSDLADCYNWIGNANYSMGNYKEALISHEKALKIRKESLPSTNPDLAKSYNNIGSVYSNLGDYSKALLSHEKALEIRQQSLPSTHPDLVMSNCNIGLVYSKIGDHKRALDSHEKALEISLQSLPSTHPSLASVYNNIGLAHSKMGIYSEALASYKKALEIKQQSMLPTHPSLAISYNNIGGIYFNMGDYSEALSCYEIVLEIRQRSLLPPHPDLAQSYNNIGSAYYSMRDYSKAHSFYKHAVDIGQQSLPLEHPDVQNYRNNLERVKSQL